MRSEGRFSKAAAAQAYSVSVKIVARWLERFKAAVGGRSARARAIHRATAQLIVDRIVALRRERRTGKHIAITVGVSPGTVSRALRGA